jgi:hypothetical protein
VEALRSKATIAVLAIIAAVSMSAHMVLILFDPAAMKLAHAWGASAGQADWVMTALFWLGPLWLAFVAIASKGTAGRWVTFVAAAVLTMLNLWHFFICAVPLMAGGPYTKPTAQHVLLVGSSVVATALSAWYAWRCPNK